MESFWRLPGPSRFLETVAGDLRDGASVVLRSGRELPTGLADQLERRTAPMLVWTHLNAEAGVAPVLTIRRTAAPAAPTSELGTPREIVLDRRLGGRVFWVRGLTPENWPDWRDFLASYAHARRNDGATARPPAFILPLCGAGFSGGDIMDPSVSARELRNVVDQDDLFVMALQDPNARAHPRITRSLLAHTVAQVAQWDHLLALDLLDGGLEAALQPHDTLARYAKENGWTTDTSEHWEAGTLDGPHEHPVAHSALLFVQEREPELNRRIWAGQAAVLMPILEERRLEILQMHGHRLELPFESEFGVVRSPEQMELGPLAHYFSLHRRSIPHLVRPVRRLNKFRRKLAHLTPLSFQEATHTTLLRPFR